MAPQFRGAHYAVRSIWWGAEGVKTSTSGFSIFFCEAFPFIQPSRIAIRSSGVRVVGETTGLRMAARRQGRFLQPWRQLSGTDRTAQILPQPHFPPSAWKWRLPAFLMGPFGVITDVENTHHHHHHHPTAKIQRRVGGGATSSKPRQRSTQNTHGQRNQSGKENCKILGEKRH